MTKVFSILFLISLAPAMSLGAITKPVGVTCKAVYTYADQQGKYHEESQDMLVTYNIDGQVRWEIDIHEMGLIAHFEESTGDMTLGIVKAPNYTHGVRSQGQPLSYGVIQLGYVDGSTVYKIICSKK